MALSSLLLAATGTYFFGLPNNEFSTQKNCIGFLLTNYVAVQTISQVTGLFKQFFARSGRNDNDPPQPESEMKRGGDSYLWEQCITLNEQFDGAMRMIPMAVLLLLVASSNAGHNTMRSLAVTPFIPVLINPLPIPYPYGWKIRALCRVTAMILAVGASATMVKSEYF